MSSSRNFFGSSFEEPSRRASSSRESADASNPFAFNFSAPLNNTFSNLTRSFINSPTISNFMSGSRTANNPHSTQSNGLFYDDVWTDFPSMFDSLDLNLGSFSGSSPRDANCESCHSKFTLLKRRKTCAECQLDFCSNCFSPPASSPSSTEPEYSSEVRPRRFCRKCRYFVTRPLDRRLLMRLTVKDLKFYLQKRRINCVHCKEKSELVDLVLQHNGYRVPSHGGEASPSATSYRNQRRSSEDPFVERNPPSGSSSSNHSSADSWVLLEDNDHDEDTPVRPPERPAPLDRAEGGIPLVDPHITTEVTAPKLSTSVADTTSVKEFKAFSIDDIKSEEQLRELSARQLKLILTRNFVNYKGACEREELMDKVLRLWREKKELNAKLDEISDENLCKICMEAPIDCVLLECGHLISCVACGKRLSECPLCRQYIVRAVRTFKS